jgi:hypothetical protein
MTRPTRTLTDLPYDILQDIVAMAGTSAVTGKRREWKAKDMERVRDGTPVQEARPRQVLVDSAPTNNLVNLMKVSKALYWIAGAEIVPSGSTFTTSRNALADNRLRPISSKPQYRFDNSTSLWKLETVRPASFSTVLPLFTFYHEPLSCG